MVLFFLVSEMYLYDFILQMIQPCYGVSSSTMIFSHKLVLSGMFSQSYCSERTNQLSLLKRDGLSLGGFTSMVIIVSCHPQMPTHGYQMIVLAQLSLYFFQSWHYFCLWHSYLLMCDESCLCQSLNYLLF